MNFLRQDFQKVTSNRRIDRQTNRYDWNYIQKLYTLYKEIIYHAASPVVKYALWVTIRVETYRHEYRPGGGRAAATRWAAGNSQRVCEVVGRRFRDENVRRPGRLLLLLLLRCKDASSTLSNDAVQYSLLSLYTYRWHLGPVARSHWNHYLIALQLTNITFCTNSF